MSNFFFRKRTWSARYVWRPPRSRSTCVRSSISSVNSAGPRLHTNYIHNLEIKFKVRGGFFFLTWVLDLTEHTSSQIFGTCLVALWLPLTALNSLSRFAISNSGGSRIIFQIYNRTVSLNAFSFQIVTTFTFYALVI